MTHAEVIRALGYERRQNVTPLGRCVEGGSLGPGASPGRVVVPPTARPEHTRPQPVRPSPMTGTP